MTRSNIEYLMSNIKRNMVVHSFENQKGERELTREEVLDITNYLRNPTNLGIWKLNADWNIDNSICSFISSGVENYIKNKKQISIQIGKRKVKINVSETDVINRIKNQINKLTFQFRLFTYIYDLNKPKKEQSTDFLLDFFDTEDIILFDMIDIKEINKRYKDAYNLYIKNIFYEGLKPTVWVNRILKFQKGNFLLDELDKKILITSLNYSSLVFIKDFLEKLNLIDEVRVERIFSPEEILFEPYIIYLNSVYPNIIEYDVFKRLLSRAISEFDGKNYSHCIGTIGIMAEDIFIQIYETLFREEVQKGLTLGQLFDQIHIRINKEISSENKVSTASISSLFSEINHIVDRTKPSSKVNVQKEIAEFTRKLLQYLKEQEQSTRELIKRSFSPKPITSIFPKPIHSNLNELVKYRNAISHKSRIPIGSYEAIRCVYCVITLLIWWTEEKRKIDWTKSKEKIILDIIDRNN